MASNGFSQNFQPPPSKFLQCAVLHCPRTLPSRVEESTTHYCTYHIAGQNAAQLPSVPQGVQGIRPLLGTQQQPIVMFLPAANNILPQKIVAAEQGVPTQPVAVTSNGLTWSSELQPQGQGNAREKESGE